MTIVIAQSCTNGAAAICSDSQATSGSDWKTLSVKKIHIIHGKSPAFVVGYSGNPTYGGYAVRQLHKLEDFSIENIEERVGAVFDKFIDREVRRGSPGLGYTLAVILTEDEKLRIYKISEEGVAVRVSETPYLCIGSGTVWADWLMSEFGRFTLNSTEAVELATYVIGMTSQVDPNVGGEIQAVRVVNPSKNGLSIKLEGHKLEEVKKAAAEKRQMLQAFWYAINEKEVLKLMRKQLGPILKTGQPGE